MKIVVIGCTHAGTAAILNSRKLYPDAEITVYERNDNISFLSCGIALYVGGVIDDVNGLFYSSPKALSDLNVTTKMQHDVTKIDTEQKTITAKDIQSGTEITDTYDKLIITSGSWPIIPPIEGIDLDNILLCKNFNHTKTIIEKSETAKKIAVIGAGYIGVEMAEAFKNKGKDVTLIDTLPRIMAKYFDKEFTDAAEAEFKSHGIKLALGECVKSFSGNGKVEKILTDKNEYDVDLVIMCIGFHPNTEIFENKIDMIGCKAIKVDRFMRTSNKDIMAAGDCATVYDNAFNKDTYIPLATNAVRMGTLAAINLLEDKVKHPGTQGTSGIQIYDISLASTGLTEETATNMGMKVKSITINDNYRPEFMPSTEMVTLKVVFEEESKRIVGAIISSKQDVTLAINTLSLCIQQKMTVTDLAFVDFFFQPHFNKPWNFINLVGLQALQDNN